MRQAIVVSDFINRLSRYLDLADHLEFEALLRHRQLCSTDERKRVVRAIRRRIAKRRKATEHQVHDAMLLLACLPESRLLLKKLMLDQRSVVAAEMRFSICVWVDRIFDTGSSFEKRSRHFLDEFPGIVRTYLCNVQHERASSTWMAGHLMGSHWDDLDMAFQVLSFAAINGKYAVGRKHSVWGLQELWQRAEPSLRRDIETLLKRIADTDRSRSIRYRANNWDR